MAEKKKPRPTAKRRLFQELMTGVQAMRAHREGQVTLRTHHVEPIAVPLVDPTSFAKRAGHLTCREPASRLPCRCEASDPSAPAEAFRGGKVIAAAGRLPLAWSRVSHLSRHVGRVGGHQDTSAFREHQGAAMRCATCGRETTSGDRCDVCGATPDVHTDLGTEAVTVAPPPAALVEDLHHRKTTGEQASGGSSLPGRPFTPGAAFGSRY